MPPPEPRRCLCSSARMAEPPQWRLRTRRLTLDRPLIMGILNVTPDSFSDGGEHFNREAAIRHGLALAAVADIVDVGGESTRPGADPVPADVERERVLPVVAALAEAGAVVSIDTTKAAVAVDAIAAGAEIVNDVTAAGEPEMAGVMADSGVGVVLMHMQGTPRTMQVAPRYDDVVGEVGSFLEARATLVRSAGADPAAIAIDPGLGFGKTVVHNTELLRRLGDLVAIGYPVVIGASRKTFLGKLSGSDVAADRDNATIATTALAVAAGAACVRVHEVERSRQVADVAWAIARSREGPAEVPI